MVYRTTASMACAARSAVCVELSGGEGRQSHLIALVHVPTGAAEASVIIERILATLEELCHQSFRTKEALPSDPAAGPNASLVRACASAWSELMGTIRAVGA